MLNIFHLIKKSVNAQDLDPNPFLYQGVSRIRIQDPDPHQKEMDPKHFHQLTRRSILRVSNTIFISGLQSFYLWEIWPSADGCWCTGNVIDRVGWCCWCTGNVVDRVSWCCWFTEVMLLIVLDRFQKKCQNLK